MKLTSTIWPLVAIVAGGLLLRKRKASGVGYMPGYHPADLYSPQDVNDFRAYLEAGYGKGFTEAELEPWERNRWAMMKEAEKEHELRIIPTIDEARAMTAQLKKQRKQASARAALDDYVKYLNHRYGAGWHPGLINPQDSDVYYQLLEEVMKD